MLLLGGLGLVVADAILAGDEDHACRAKPRDMPGVMTCAAEDRLVRVSMSVGRRLQSGANVFRELQCLRGNELIDIDRAGTRVLAADLTNPIALLAQRGAGWVAHIDREMHVPGNDRDPSGPNLEPADREAHLIGVVGKCGAQCHGHVGRGDESVLAATNGHGAGMSILTGDIDCPASIALHPGADTDHMSRGLKLDALFDMTFQEGSDRRPEFARRRLRDRGYQIVNTPL